MATYYKYAERDVNSQIDWGKIGQDVTEMLKEQARLKAEKEQAFDKQTTELEQFIDKVPQGDWRSLNQKYQDATQDFQEYRLQQDRLYKSGLLDPRQYKMNRQRNLDDVTLFYDIGKDAQTAYKEATERLQAGTSSFTEQDVLLSVEGLGNMQNIKPIINPATGGLQIARMKKGPDGVEVVDTENTMSMHEMNNYLKFKQDKFDKDGFITSKVNLLGDKVTSEMIEARSQGDINYVLENTNKALRDDIDAVIAATAGEIQANPFNAASILGDWTGEEYTLTDSETEAEKDPNKIYKYFDENGTLRVKLTDVQNEKVEKYIRQQMLASFDEKVLIPKMTNKPYAPQPSGTSLGMAKADRVALSEAEAYRDLYVGTADEKTAASNALLGSEFARTEGLVEIAPVKDANGKLIAYDFNYQDTDKNVRKPVGKNLEEWMRGVNEVTGTIDPNIIDEAMTGFTDTPLSTVLGTTARRSGADKQETIENGYKRLLQEEYGLTREVFVDDEDQVEANLNTLFQTTPGLQDFIVESSNVGSDEVEIKKREGQSMVVVATLALDDITDDTKDRYIKTILDLASANATTAQKGLVTQDKLKRDTTTQPVQGQGQGQGGKQAPRPNKTKDGQTQ